MGLLLVPYLPKVPGHNCLEKVVVARVVWDPRCFARSLVCGLGSCSCPDPLRRLCVRSPFVSHRMFCADMDLRVSLLFRLLAFSQHLHELQSKVFYPI